MLYGLALQVEDRALRHNPDVCFHRLGLYQAQRGNAGMKFLQHGSLFVGREERVMKAGLRQADQLHCGESHAMHVPVLVAHGGFEHGWVVAGERYG